MFKTYLAFNELVKAFLTSSIQKTGWSTRRRFATPSILPLERTRRAQGLPHGRILAQPHKSFERRSELYFGVRGSPSLVVARLGVGGKTGNPRGQDVQSGFFKGLLDAAPPASRRL